MERSIGDLHLAHHPPREAAVLASSHGKQRGAKVTALGSIPGQQGPTGVGTGLQTGFLGPTAP